MDVLDPKAWLPHRPPILLLDRVTEIEPGQSGVGWRRFEKGAACFAGHFPDRPILPGVLTIEALAQTAMVVLLTAEDEGSRARHGYLQRVREMSFHRPIEPGETIHFRIRVDKRLGSFYLVSGRVEREGELCAKGQLAVGMEKNDTEEDA